MSPFRNAMSLIDCKQSEWSFGKTCSKIFVREALGSHVKEPYFIFLKSSIEFTRFVRRESGVKSGSWDSFGDERVNLIFHQGD